MPVASLNALRRDALAALEDAILQAVKPVEEEAGGNDS